LPIKQNKHALLEKLRMIEYRYLGNGLRYRINFGCVFFSPRGIFSTTSVKKFKKAGPVFYGLRGLLLPQPSEFELKSHDIKKGLMWWCWIGLG
jgi:hypothetical protein